MSYEVLARRWRPQSFADLVGQSHVATTLENAIKSGRLPHAILLCGPRGVGKTSIARILARALNCDSGPTTEPCGTCPACKGILAGNSLDVQEIDAASHTGVDNVREIRESIRYSAGPGKYRIFIVDEVHMLSSAAFNALLKTLEEPPPQSLFVLATTDPQKIPATVLSRVQRFDLRRHSSSQMLGRLQQIAEAEKIQVPEGVLRAITRESDGSMRDALTLLDRLTSGLGNEIDAAGAASVLDWIDRPLLDSVLDAVLSADAQAALHATRRALEGGAEPARLAGDLLVELRNLIVARLSDSPEQLIDEAPEEVQAIRERAAKHDADHLQRLFRVLLGRTAELGNGPRPEFALEMAIVRLATLPDTESISSLLQRLDELSNGSAGGGAAGPGGSGGGQPRAARTGDRTGSPRPAPARKTSGKSSTAKTSPAEAIASEPPPPAHEDASAAPPRGEEPAPPTRPDLPAEVERARRDPEREMRLRAEAKQHPAVTRAIELLDAEIREIRVGPRP